MTLKYFCGQFSFIVYMHLHAFTLKCSLNVNIQKYMKYRYKKPEISSGQQTFIQMIFYWMKFVATYAPTFFGVINLPLNLSFTELSLPNQGFKTPTLLYDELNTPQYDNYSVIICLSTMCSDINIVLLTLV